MSDKRLVGVCRHCRTYIVLAKTSDEQWFSLDTKRAWNRGACLWAIRGVHEPILAEDKDLVSATVL